MSPNFKTLTVENWLEPDEASTSFERLSLITGERHPLQGEDYAAAILIIQLSSKVPDDVVGIFRGARGGRWSTDTSSLRCMRWAKSSCGAFAGGPWGSVQRDGRTCAPEDPRRSDRMDAWSKRAHARRAHVVGRNQEPT